MRYIDSESESENSSYLFNNSRTEKDSFENQLKNFPVDKMLKIFEDKKPEEEIDETPIKANEGENNEIITSPTPEERRTNLFIVSISPDNIKRKIQVHYLTFIVLLINDILESFGFTTKFLNLDYEFKKIVNKSHFSLLKNSTIGDIISNKISNKYKKKEKDYNSNLYEYIKTFEFLRKIFNMNYLEFFKMFYMKNERTVDLKIFGIEKVISLSEKTETYYDLLEKEKDEKYIKHIDECINKNYKKERFELY